MPPVLQIVIQAVSEGLPSDPQATVPSDSIVLRRYAQCVAALIGVLAVVGC